MSLLSVESATRRVRERSEALYESAGAYPTAYVASFGCQMNARESEHILGMLKAMGYVAAQGEREADVVVYNTCCVRENAENKVYGKLGYLKRYKTEMPGKIIALCGCMAQRGEVVRELREHHKHIDILFGTHNKHRFPALLCAFLEKGAPLAEIWDESGPPEGSCEYPTERFLPHKTGVNIMYGCDNFCSYCIVPYVRGRERSRPFDEVISEINALADDGAREVMLLGQNVNSYGKDQQSRHSFAGLLRRVNDIEGLSRIRFMTSHPKDLSDELIEAMRDCEKVCKHIHLPLQAGGDGVLARMNRGYTRGEYLRLIEKLRAAVPDIAITTDIIVGFPGETEADFADTLGAVREAGFAGAFTFVYSPRAGTPAAEFTDNVPAEVSSERFERLLDLIKPMQLAHNMKNLGGVIEVMVDGRAADGLYKARAEDNTPVHFSGGTYKPGDMAGVLIDECKTFHMRGRSIEAR
jgi:tRNA-2-methylthio-N6-dimethylallyladenosine synthase